MREEQMLVNKKTNIKKLYTYIIHHKSTSMFKNYFKAAWRNLVKNKAYSFINIGGLAIGMAVATLIGFWVYDEVTYNHNNKNYESIAEVRRLYTDPNTHQTFGVDNMHYPTVALLRNNYSQYF